MPDGLPIFYVDEGERAAEALFLIHGEPTSTRFWSRNIPDLATRFRVVAIDVRGRGESGKTDEGHTIAQYARDVRDVMHALGLESVIIVGWSLGASIAWNFIDQFGSERLAGFVNVDQPPYRFVSEEQLDRKLTAIRTRRLMHHHEALVRQIGPEVSPDETDVRSMVYECMKTPTSAHTAILTEAYHADDRPLMSKVNIPSRVFWARYGNIDAPTAAEMADAMHAELVFFEHSGHLLPWVEHDRFNAELRAFAGEVLR